MGNYYDYTDEFRELITNSETIIENQEEIINKLENETNVSNLIAYTLILIYVVSIIRKIFKSR